MHSYSSPHPTYYVISTPHIDRFNMERNQHMDDLIRTKKCRQMHPDRTEVATSSSIYSRPTISDDHYSWHRCATTPADVRYTDTSSGIKLSDAFAPVMCTDAHPIMRCTQNRWSKLKQSFMITLFLLAVARLQSSHAKIRSRDPGDPVGNIRHVLPEIELGNNSVTDVRFNVGSTAFLPCRFPSFPRPHEVGQNRVSWVRRWDWHILTAGRVTYSYDDRFVVLHRDGTNEWTLQIKFLENNDNGTYECQVHSGSGFMSQFVNLHVVTPRALILESRELTVKNGDNFGLTCIIQQSLEPPVYVMWLHGGVPVNYAPDRPRLTVQMEVKGSKSRSLLKIKDAKYTDSGNYTCTAPNAVNAWVLVYVTEGDTVAAVQRRHPDTSGVSPSSGVASSSSSAGVAASAAVSPVGSDTPAAATTADAATVISQWVPYNILVSLFLQVILLKLVQLSFSDVQIGPDTSQINITKPTQSYTRLAQSPKVVTLYTELRHQSEAHTNKAILIIAR